MSWARQFEYGCVNFGERVADRADSPVIRLRILVDLVRCTKELVGLGYEHVGDSQPGAVVCR